MKKHIKLLAILVAVFIAISFTKDVIIKTVVEKGSSLVTGLTMSIRSFNAGLITQTVNIRGLTLLNPAGFEDKLMLDMPQIYTKYDMPAIFSGTVHLRDLKINMKEFIVVKNAKGELNLDSLKVVKNKDQKAGKTAKTKGKAPKFLIDRLSLKIGKALYKDYSKGGEPQVREFPINIDETYTNIDDPYSLVSLIVVKSLTNTAIANLTNFDLSGLSKNIPDVLSSAQQAASQALGKSSVAASSAIKAVSSAIPPDTAQKTEAAVKGTADTLGKVAGSLFGGTRESN